MRRISPAWWAGLVGTTMIAAWVGIRSVDDRGAGAASDRAASGNAGPAVVSVNEAPRHAGDTRWTSPAARPLATPASEAQASVAPSPSATDPSPEQLAAMFAAEPGLIDALEDADPKADPAVRQQAEAFISSAVERARTMPMLPTDDAGPEPGP